MEFGDTVKEYRISMELWDPVKTKDIDGIKGYHKKQKNIDVIGGYRERL